MYLARLSLGVIRRKHQNRTTEAVSQEYSEGWKQYEQYLTASALLEDWLNAPRADGAAYYFNLKGKLAYGNFNSGLYYRETLIAALRSHFPDCQIDNGIWLGRRQKFAIPQKGNSDA